MKLRELIEEQQKQTKKITDFLQYLVYNYVKDRYGVRRQKDVQIGNFYLMKEHINVAYSYYIEGDWYQAVLEMTDELWLKFEDI